METLSSLKKFKTLAETARKAYLCKDRVLFYRSLYSLIKVRPDNFDMFELVLYIDPYLTNVFGNEHPFDSRWIDGLLLSNFENFLFPYDFTELYHKIVVMCSNSTVEMAKKHMVNKIERFMFPVDDFYNFRTFTLTRMKNLQKPEKHKCYIPRVFLIDGYENFIDEDCLIHEGEQISDFYDSLDRTVIINEKNEIIINENNVHISEYDEPVDEDDIPVPSINDFLSMVLSGEENKKRKKQELLYSPFYEEEMLFESCFINKKPVISRLEKVKRRSSKAWALLFKLQKKNYSEWF